MKVQTSLSRPARSTPEWVYFRGDCSPLAAAVTNYVVDTGLATRAERALRLHYIDLELGALPAGANFTVGENAVIQLQRRYTSPAALITLQARDLLWEWAIVKQDETQVGFVYWEQFRRFYFEIDDPDTLIVGDEMAFVTRTTSASNIGVSFKVCAEYVDISRLDKIELLSALA